MDSRAKSALKKSSKATPRSRMARAVMDALETRRMLSVVTVNSTADSDARDLGLTLREAIEYVNGTLAYGSLSTQEQAQIDNTQPPGTNDTIKFNIPGTGLQTIYPQSQLPAITKTVTIDGYSQPGSHAATSGVVAYFQVAIDGVDASNASGLAVEAPNVTIDGLMIYRFTGPDGPGGDGIDLTTGSGNDTIQGNYLGTDGTRSLGNDAGIVVEQGSSNNTIGGTAIADRNVISGNQAGISIFRDVFVDTQVTDNVIEGNYIGTDATGRTAIANVDGIDMSRTENNTIGGVTTGAGNLISGNTADGISLNYYGQDTTIEGNYIGVTADGSAALGNGANGIDDSVAHGVTIGSAVAGGGNVISGNGGDGILIGNDGSAVIVNNRIGTNALGNAGIANTGDGIVLNDDDNATIGGTGANTANVISGNGTNGIELNAADDVTIQGNFIGTDANGDEGDTTGDGPLGNTSAGILIDNDSSNNTIGGTTAAARNVISANNAAGVQIDGGDPTYGGSTSGNVVEGNYIGVDGSGEFGFGDGDAGVLLDLGAMNNTIGGTAPGAGNVISGIAGAGVYLSGLHPDYSGGSGQAVISTANTVEGNYIGTDATGTKAVSAPHDSLNANPPYFAGIGVYLDTGTYGNVIGGTTAAARNIISGNMASGVDIDDNASTNTVEGNYIGVDITGTKALGNGYSGVVILGGCEGNIIGGSTAGAGNVISANGTAASSAGVEIGGGSGYQDPKSQNVIQGNEIGTDATALIALGNSGPGVLVVDNASDNTIGGNFASTGNVIAYNAGAGVAIVQDTGISPPETSVGNTVRLNSIYANAGLGIDLGNDGVTSNDPQDSDTGANDLQNFPVVVAAAATASSVTVSGTLNSLANENFTLDFYASSIVDAHGNSQGKEYLGSIGVVTDSNGNTTFSGTFNAAIGSNKYITATATNASTAPYGDTSEFSQAVQATAAPATASIAAAPQPGNAVVGSSIADKATVTGSNPSGTVTFNLYNNANATGPALFTDTQTLSGGTATSAAYTTSATGTDYWVATYNGDKNNSRASTGNSNQPVKITAATPTITTVAQPAIASVGDKIADKATVTGGYNPSGTVTFNLYNNTSPSGTPLFTDTEALSQGMATSANYTTTASGTDYWVATFNPGNGNNVSVSSGPAAAPVTINKVTASPTANKQTVGVNENTPTTITLTGSDPNSPPQSLTYTVTANPVHGTLSGTAPNLTYTPAAGYTGSDSFQFTDSNGTKTSAAAIVTLNISQATGTTVSQFNGTPSANTTASYNNSGNTFAKAFDGNTSTFFDAPNASGNWVQLDLGSAQTITQIKYAPRVGFESRMVGGIFEVSNDSTFASGVVTLFTVTATPADGLTSKAVSLNSTYRYVRYVSPANSHGNIAEFQVFGPAGSTPVPSAPSAPGTPSLKSDTSTSATIAWTASSSNNVTGYLILRNGKQVGSTNGSTLTYTDNNLSPNTPYSYTVEAVAGTLDSPPTAPLQITTPPASGSTTTVQLTGTASANTTSSYQNNGNTFAKAFDGNTNTYFDAPNANGNYVTLNLGSAKTITQIKYAPRVGYESRLIGGYFEASNDPNFATGVTLLYTINTAPSDGLTTVNVNANVTGTYQYVRYIAPAGSYGNIAEMQIFGY